MSTGAKAEINIDGKTFDATRAAKDSTMKGSASRFTYDMAADHVYKLLLKEDLDDDDAIIVFHFVMCSMIIDVN